MVGDQLSIARNEKRTGTLRHHLPKQQEPSRRDRRDCADELCAGQTKVRRYARGVRLGIFRQLRRRSRILDGAVSERSLFGFVRVGRRKLLRRFGLLHWSRHCWDGAAVELFSQKSRSRALKSSS